MRVCPMTSLPPPECLAAWSPPACRSRMEQHLTAGRVYVEGEQVTDPYRSAPPPARIVIQAA